MSRAGSTPHEIPRRSRAHGRDARVSRGFVAVRAARRDRRPSPRSFANDASALAFHDDNLDNRQAPRVANAGGVIGVELDVQGTHGRGVWVFGSLGNTTRDGDSHLLVEAAARRAVEGSGDFVVEGQRAPRLERAAAAGDAMRFGAEGILLDGVDAKAVSTRGIGEDESVGGDGDVARELTRGEAFPIDAGGGGGGGRDGDVLGERVAREGERARVARGGLRGRVERAGGGERGTTGLRDGSKIEGRER